MQSDTAVVPRGGGTGGSRSLQIGGSAVLGAADDRARAGPRARAAELLEAAVDDIVAHRRRPRSAWPACRRRRSRGREVAAAPRPSERARWREHDFQPGRAPRSRSARTSRWSRSTPRPAGSRRVRHIAVDDCGRILNPLLVAGQQHGGIAQGIAQALWEEVVYDADGNPLTATLADYAHAQRGRAPRRSRPPTPRRPRRSTRSAPRASASRPRSARRPRCRTRWSTRSATSACATSTCRARPSGCGGRSRRAGGVDPWREPPAVFATLPVREAGSAAAEGGEI